MPETSPPTILCLASYEKGHDFLRQCHREGCTTLLVTSQSLAEAPWPRECIDELFLLPDENHEWRLPDLIHGVSYLARSRRLDRIVALDDFDVEKAAALREHLRVPGLGESAARFFRDKLAMRLRAQAAGLPVPRFTPLFPYDAVRAFLADVPPPYLLKPRSSAGAIGIQTIGRGEDLWPALEALGDRQSYFLLESFVPGDIFHVDSLVADREVVFARASAYGRPPLETSHLGRVFSTRTLSPASDAARALCALNAAVLRALGLERGVSHSEYIRGGDGQLYFLETSARVGGAHIAEMVEAATGINLWAEWAKLEAHPTYAPPVPQENSAGLLLCLAKQEWPEYGAYADPEICWRLAQRHHAGLIVRSPDPARVEALLSGYTERFYQDFFASLPPAERPGH